ncbi:MAG: SDR family NAD(P)-dependent oxidoreductase, partial [Cytophagales bacterium]|nr:SDR family NAD(P)-dependent oxidoreductase [Cytophagales bacterium]
MSSKTKIALVTGANKGIGFETAKQLAESGIKVILTARDPAKGNEAFQKLKGKGLDVSFFKLDVSISEDISKIKEYVEKSFGKLDILVNNAGMIQGEDWGSNSVESVSMKDLRTTFDVNFFGLVELTQVLLPLIKKSDAGRIVNLSSIMGSLELHSKPNSPIYNSKPF